MKNRYGPLSSTHKLRPTTGIRINTALTEGTQYNWQGTPVEALCSKKLWSILHTLSRNPETVDGAVETAIEAELIARGDHASSVRWRTPH